MIKPLGHEPRGLFYAVNLGEYEVPCGFVGGCECDVSGCAGSADVVCPNVSVCDYTAFGEIDGLSVVILCDYLC